MSPQAQFNVEECRDALQCVSTPSCVLKSRRPIHHLLKIAEGAKLDLSEEQKNFLLEVTAFNIEARYPDHKSRFYKKATREFSAYYVKTIKEFRRWLIKKINS